MKIYWNEVKMGFPVHGRRFRHRTSQMKRLAKGRKYWFK